MELIVFTAVCFISFWVMCYVIEYIAHIVENLWDKKNRKYRKQNKGF